MRARLFGLLALGMLIAAQGADDVKKELPRHAGDWIAVSMERDGKKLPDDKVSALRRTVKGTQYMITAEGNVLGKGTFKVDPGKKPMQIDITRLEPQKDPPVLGIYEIDGDTYKVCYGTPGKERPTEFESKEGTGVTLAIWKRVKK